MKFESAEKSQDTVIFGFQDPLTGQLISFLNESERSRIRFIASISEIPILNVEEEHNKRPNNKTEFPQDGRVFGKKILHFKEDGLSYAIKELESINIKRCFILEECGSKRKKLYEIIKKSRINIMNYVHKTVYIGEDCSIGEGSIVFPNCHIGYKTDIGVCSILESNCIVEHHNKVGNFCDIFPGLTTGGFTEIGDLCEINLSVDIINRIKIKRGSRIGAGSLVLKDTCQDSLYYGRPARLIRNRGEY